MASVLREWRVTGGLNRGSTDQAPRTLFLHTEDGRSREQKQTRLGGKEGSRNAETKLEADKESRSGLSLDRGERA